MKTLDRLRRKLEAEREKRAAVGQALVGAVEQTARKATKKKSKSKYKAKGGGRKTKKPAKQVKGKKTYKPKADPKYKKTKMRTDRLTSTGDQSERIEAKKKFEAWKKARSQK